MPPAPEARPADRDSIRELIARYDRPGPRYTSFPTAVEFGDDFGPAAYAERLAAADARGDEPLSLYLHLPFCQERCLFCGCHVIITPHQDRAAPYLRLLAREVELVAARLPNRRRTAQLHLGGGTPTYHGPDELTTLVESVLARFPPADGAELAVEVDPRVTRFAHVDALAALGFNRISLGVQDLTAEVQERIRRVQSLQETEALVRRARERGFTGVNVDLIYGLPRQRPETFEATVEAVIALGADRVAVYSFAYVPWLRGHQKEIAPEELPPRERKLELFAVARERFLAAGYEPLGMDHFALPSDELARARRERRLKRNFQGYAVVPGTDSLGFGISAIGDVRGAYVQNLKKLSTYERAVSDGELPVERGLVRSRDDELRRRLIHELMCNFAIDRTAFEDELGEPFAAYFAADLAELAEYRDAGLVEVGDDRIEATPTGELFVRNLAMCFDPYLRRKRAGDGPVFSRTV